MPAGIEIDAIRIAFTNVVRSNAEQAAFGNDYIAERGERPGLSPFLREVADRVRAAKGKGARLRVNELTGAAALPSPRSGGDQRGA